MNPFTRQLQRQRTRGNALLTFILLLPVAFLFVGLAIDFGTAYMAKAQLSKAVDSACLVGIRNYYQGVGPATAIATAQFAANYGNPRWGTGAVTPTVTFGTDANNNRTLTVTASATIHTLFIRLIPQWKTLQVNANAQANRANLIMSLALDRSGSMGLPPPSGSGGGAALPGAVATFLTRFDDNNDTVGMVSFATIAKTNVAIGHPFKTTINNAVNAFTYSGATFSLGGLSNAAAQIASRPTTPNENVMKVCVFFTDGLANTDQGPFRIPARVVLNFGGNDSGNAVGFFDPTTGVQLDLGSSTPTAFWAYDCSCAKNMVQPNVTGDAQYRCIQTANTMRANGVFVFCIGLGTGINQTFLQQVANDPNVPGYVPTAYDGVAVFAPTAAQLAEMFELIASKVLLRLSQ